MPEAERSVINYLCNQQFLILFVFFSIVINSTGQLIYVVCKIDRLTGLND